MARDEVKEREQIAVQLLAGVYAHRGAHPEPTAPAPTDEDLYLVKWALSVAEELIARREKKFGKWD